MAMAKYLLDANSIMKWFDIPNEETSNPLRYLYEQMLHEEVKIFAPDLLLIEVSNVLIKKKKFSEGDTQRIVRFLVDSPIQFYALLPEEMTHVVSLMTKHSVTAYDAVYLFFAIKENLQLITEDHVLLRVKTYSIHPRDLS
jgi:predicted nucleic acid-binding protein